MLGKVLRLRLALTAALAAGLTAVAATAAEGATHWLCHPALKGDACDGALTTTVYEPDGGSHVVEPRVAERRRIDCFYVYPTVSNQPGPNATVRIDPELEAIALYQAARFSSDCRVFAPVYRQITLLALFTGGITDEARRIAYADVRAAWREYLRKHNRGRGVVLIGHSQGTGMLRTLIREQIDRRPAVRRRLVSALLLGGNVLVRKGRDRGGDFRNVPACRARRQTGCVVAYSTFNRPVPADARFGRAPSGTDPLTGRPGGRRYEVLCTNPASLGANRRAPMTTFLPSEPFPLGLIHLGILQTYGGLPPSAPTPWLRPADRYEGRCVRSNGANVLMVRPLPGARELNPSPDPGWGLHLVDVNGALGNLQRVVRVQAASYLKRAKNASKGRRPGP